MTRDGYLNCTGRPRTWQELVEGVEDPGPCTDSVIAGYVRAMTPNDAEEIAGRLAILVKGVLEPTAVMIDGPDWRVDALRAAFARLQIDVVTRAEIGTRIEARWGHLPVAVRA